jgi:hypothetical protein
MTDEMSAGSLLCAAYDALQNGQRVSVKVDGNADWIEFEAVKSTWPGTVELRLPGGRGSVIVPHSRVVAMEIGESAP